MGLNDEENIVLSDVLLYKYGFYTDIPEEFEKRIDEIEDSLNKAEYVFDDPQEWIEIDDFKAAMRKEHSWFWVDKSNNCLRYNLLSSIIIACFIVNINSNNC